MDTQNISPMILDDMKVHVKLKLAFNFRARRKWLTRKTYLIKKGRLDILRTFILALPPKFITKF
jgi:hypothetical protein